MATSWNKCDEVWPKCGWDEWNDEWLKEKMWNVSELEEDDRCGCVTSAFADIFNHKCESVVSRVLRRSPVTKVTEACAAMWDYKPSDRWYSEDAQSNLANARRLDSSVLASHPFRGLAQRGSDASEGGESFLFPPLCLYPSLSLQPLPFPSSFTPSLFTRLSLVLSPCPPISSAVYHNHITSVWWSTLRAYYVSHS